MKDPLLRNELQQAEERFRNEVAAIADKHKVQIPVNISFGEKPDQPLAEPKPEEKGSLKKDKPVKAKE
jgi:hypothetical protein